MSKAELAIIGGTGVSGIDLLENIEKVEVDTPYGKPSDVVTIGEYQGRKIAFLPRHGAGHSVVPHKINYRANINALKQLGVTRILSACAVGSLQPEYHPGELAFVDQFIDFTRGRDATFFAEDDVFHVSLADPTCCELRQLGIAVAKTIAIPMHEVGTYVCIQGPRYSTRAESLFFKDMMKAHVIGMTMATECTLAREAEICYMPIACVTDYDVWAENPVSAQAVREVMQKNVTNVKKVIFDILPKIPGERNHCECGKALDGARQ